MKSTSAGLTVRAGCATLNKTVEAEIKPAAHAQRSGTWLKAPSQRTGKWTAEGARNVGRTPHQYCATQSQR